MPGCAGRWTPWRAPPAGSPPCCPTLAVRCPTTCSPRCWGCPRCGSRIPTRRAASTRPTSICWAAWRGRRCRSWRACSGTWPRAARPLPPAVRGPADPAVPCARDCLATSRITIGEMEPDMPSFFASFDAWTAVRAQQDMPVPITRLSGRITVPGVWGRGAWGWRALRRMCRSALRGGPWSRSSSSGARRKR
ncbi:hypothethical protein (plasmid) [Ralstonia solanacearum PSI07]|nr:hypothethical protein [Ralstonia solanacearum PSI07]